MDTPTAPGKPKRKRGGQPGNRNAWRHGFYSDKFTPDELRRARGSARDLCPDDEIWMMRILNRRLFDLLGAQPGAGRPDLSVEQLVALARALTTSTGRLTRLLYARRALSPNAADDLAGAINAALDEVAAELGLKL